MKLDKGNYTMYAVPCIQVEGSGVYLSDNIDVLKDQWYGACEIFETPNETIETIANGYNKGGEQGSFCNFLRGKYKLVYKSDNGFYFDKEKLTPIEKGGEDV